MPKVFMRIGSFVAASATVLAIAGAVLAGDVWKAKDYKEWNAKDVAVILNDSPWGKLAMVGKYWTTPPPPRGTKPDDSVNQYAFNPAATSNYNVRWTSAVTMRQAIARNFELTAPASTAEAERFASVVPDSYDVSVIGDMTPFGPLDTTDAIKLVQDGTDLEIKGGVAHNTPVKVELVRGADGKSVAAITFHFPKTDANGSPVIPANASAADFVCRVGKFDLKAHFDLTKMMASKGLDL